MISRQWASDPFFLITLALLLLITLAAWASVLLQASSMAMGGFPMGAEMSGSMGPLITPAGLVAFVAAWVVMMAAMMLPSAAPMILFYRAVAHGRATRGHPFVPTWIFVLGYLVVWAAFGVLVYLAGQLVGITLANDRRLAEWAPYGVALVLLLAGAYQFTPLKQVCLRACQSPLGFLAGHWKPGPGGAFRMGLEHGSYCTGCCWGLMASWSRPGRWGWPGFC